MYPRLPFNDTLCLSGHAVYLPHPKVSMAPPDSHPSPSDPTANPPTLTDRLLERVRQAGLAAHWPTDESGPKPRRRHTDAPRQPPAASRTRRQLREARSLRRVFLDMGDSYREYRSLTGAPVSARVRGAAERFRRERNLASLAAVAASLDELEVLTW